MDTITPETSRPRRLSGKVIGASTAVAVAGLLGLGVVSANAAETDAPAESSTSSQAPAEDTEAGTGSGTESGTPNDAGTAPAERGAPGEGGPATGEGQPGGAGCEDAEDSATGAQPEDTTEQQGSTAETSFFATT